MDRFIPVNTWLNVGRGSVLIRQHLGHAGNLVAWLRILKAKNTILHEYSYYYTNIIPIYLYIKTTISSFHLFILVHYLILFFVANYLVVILFLKNIIVLKHDPWGNDKGYHGGSVSPGSLQGFDQLLNLQAGVNIRVKVRSFFVLFQVLR